MCQQNSSVAARRRPHPEVELRDRAEHGAERPQRGRDHRRAPVVLLEPRRGAAGDQPQLERRARRPRADQEHLVVDRDQALAAPDLLGGDVGEQVRAHRPLVVGPGALALAGDRRRHEAERVELRVGVLERGPGVGALVDDQVHVGRVGVGAHPLAPGADRAGEPLRRQAGERGLVLRGADDHLVGAQSRLGAEQVGLAARGGAEGIDGAGDAGLQRPAARRPAAPRPSRRSAPDRGWGPSGRSSPACPARRRPGGSPRPRAGCDPRAPRRTGSARRRRGAAPAAPRSKASGRSARPGREDRPQAGELVDPDLWR